MEQQDDNGLSGLDPAELLKQGAGDDTFTENHSGSFTPPTLEELAEIFPRFEILELIGKGGMGAVYKKTPTRTGRIRRLISAHPLIDRQSIAGIQLLEADGKTVANELAELMAAFGCGG